MAKRMCIAEDDGERCSRDAVVRDMCVKHYQRWRKIQAADPSSGIPPKSPRHDLIDRTEQRFGMLVVIGRAESRRKPNGKLETYWLCQCDCGSEPVEVRSYDLGRERNTGSCGCIKGGAHQFPAGGHPLPMGRAARNKVHRDYEHNARTRGLCWELTDEDFDQLTSLPCFYCGQPPSAVRVLKGGSTFTFSGIDRMDNEIGYTAENAVPCCKMCNKAKRDVPFDEFLAWLARLTDYLWFHPDAMPSRLLGEVKKAA